MTEARLPMFCSSYVVHEPHDWVYSQVWGGAKDFKYRCPGVKSIKIEWVEDYHEGAD